MTIKQILVPLTGLGDPTHVPGLALKLAKRFDAKVDGCDTVSDQLPYIDPTGFGNNPTMMDDMFKVVAKANQERCQAAHRTFDRACAKAGISKSSPRKGAFASWASSNGEGLQFLTRHGRLSDLIVVNQPGSNSAFSDVEVLEHAVFATGRPVLAVPAGGANELNGKIAIAWNGSIEATRAVAGALPLLAGAKSVIVIQVGDASITDSGTLGRYLASHGLKPRFRMEKDRKGATGKIILDAAVDAGCGLLVMGAYTHSRVKEMILGGVTNHMFQSAGIPLLLAH
jgi:nucleotide-binding universal stress UspA family protein